MRNFTLAGRRVTVLGWARSGRPAAALAASLGADVFVSESRARTAFDADALSEINRYEHEFGGHSERALRSELIVLSPGIPRSIPALKEYRGEIWSEIELAFRVLPCQIIAVTGTNGKTTTTTLIGEIMQHGYREGRTFVAGNIGRAAAAVALQAHPTDVCVLELSSFQLESIHEFRPDIAVFLNLRSNHLDWYPDVAAYRKAKERIFMNMKPRDVAIVNIDDPVGAELSRSLSGMRVLTVSAQGDARYTLRDGYPSGILAEVKAPENLLSAVAAAETFNVAREDIFSVLSRFRGLPHRVELLGSVKGVAFYNDSKATNVASVETALRAVPEPVVLVMGGKDKGEDFAALEPLIEKKCRGVIAYGEAAERIASVLHAEVVIPFDDAVRRAFEKSPAGTSLLLSTACSSYDQFRDYVERGERFRDIFLTLKSES